MSTPFAYTLKSRASNQPACFPTLDVAVAFLTGNYNKPYRYRGSGNSPLFAHYVTGETTREVLVDDYIVFKTVNTGNIIAKLDEDIAFEQRAYDRVYVTAQDRQRERLTRSADQEWLFEKDRAVLIERELDIKRWVWSGQA